MELWRGSYILHIGLCLRHTDNTVCAINEKSEKNLHLSQSTDIKNNRIVNKKYGEIYKHYTEDCFYFELIDLTRRLILTGGLILIGEHSVVQVLLGIITALVLVCPRCVKLSVQSILG